MTVPSMIDAGGWLGKFLTEPEADGDLVRQMLGAFAGVLMSAQASMQCQARGRRWTPPNVSSPPETTPKPFNHRHHRPTATPSGQQSAVTRPARRAPKPSITWYLHSPHSPC